MKKEINSKLKSGDKIICLHMDGETSVPPMTKGTVSHTGRDPFEEDAEIISVMWDNGSTLSLLSSTDRWIKETPKQIQEQDTSTQAQFIADNPNLARQFDVTFLRAYLKKVRESGIINMLESAPLLYAGSEYIDRYYGEGREDDEVFQEVLEMADHAKDKMIQGVVNYLTSVNKEITLESANREIGKFAKKILRFYINFF
jgi:hypothetical protein